ncbi:SGNH/GDSL hydrolase family protein [Noviherbaspirillum massiliense]|uniref:SGNH/GDSL hydrolase family protein n=1 Tax=Noviherbaspirillum massiliense TaxID=1465823 RepID=UPI0002DB8115|nr:SGNH/GDSL hydrolase family protein [Noviherbaspirillum massiliense]
MLRRLLLPVILASAVTAPAFPADKPAATPLRKTASPVIEYYGDSTVWGYASGLGTQVAVPAPTAFADALASKYEVRNQGVSGTTACQLLEGTDGKHPAWEQQMASSDASFVIINHGINDLWKESLDGYQSCLRKLARIAKASGKKVIFETPNPIGADGDLASYVSAMTDVARAEKIPVIDQYRYLSNYLRGQSPYTICPDGLHPTDAIYVMKGRYAAAVFKAMVQSK